MDWRTRLGEAEREKLVTRIVTALKKYMTGKDDAYLRMVAKSFEEKEFSSADSQETYFRNIAKGMYTLSKEPKSNVGYVLPQTKPKVPVQVSPQTVTAQRILHLNQAANSQLPVVNQQATSAARPLVPSTPTPPVNIPSVNNASTGQTEMSLIKEKLQSMKSLVPLLDSAIQIHTRAATPGDTLQRLQSAKAALLSNINATNYKFNYQQLCKFENQIRKYFSQQHQNINTSAQSSMSVAAVQSAPIPTRRPPMTDSASTFRMNNQSVVASAAASHRPPSQLPPIVTQSQYGIRPPLSSHLQSAVVQPQPSSPYAIVLSPNTAPQAASLASIPSAATSHVINSSVAAPSQDSLPIGTKRRQPPNTATSSLSAGVGSNSKVSRGDDKFFSSATHMNSAGIQTMDATRYFIQQVDALSRAVPNSQEAKHVFIKIFEPFLHSRFPNLQNDC